MLLIGNNKYYCWGRNCNDELGFGGIGEQLIPIKQEYLYKKSITQLSLGGSFTIAVRENYVSSVFLIKLKRKDFIDIKIKIN